MSSSPRTRTHRIVYFELDELTLEWDSRKAAENEENHGIDFKFAAEVFLDPLHLTMPDEDHSTEEDRYETIGQVAGEALVVVIHTDRNDHLRLISARKATKRERKQYEQG